MGWPIVRVYHEEVLLESCLSGFICAVLQIVGSEGFFSVKTAARRFHLNLIQTFHCRNKGQPENRCCHHTGCVGVEAAVFPRSEETRILCQLDAQIWTGTSAAGDRFGD